MEACMFSCPSAGSSLSKPVFVCLVWCIGLTLFLFLPVGDFAVLLKAGMTVKQAIVYNLLSALMAYFGMLIGTAVGQYAHNVTSWIFAVTAGMFLYVALVDMVRMNTLLRNYKVKMPFNFCLKKSCPITFHSSYTSCGGGAGVFYSC